MTEWIISGSFLIAVVIGLRYILKGKIDLRLQYALWGLVLLRLLIPISFVSSDFSVMNAVPDDIPGAILSLGIPEGGRTKPENTVPELATPAATDMQYNTQFVPNDDYNDNISGMTTGGVDWGQIALSVWLGGIVIVGLVFVVSNLRFSSRLKRTRQLLHVADIALPIYVTESIETPCLYGLIHPAIHVTPQAARESERVMRHVLEHEMTHFRQGDHIWSILRAVSIAFHWYNPLVWWAALLSRRDCELSCDEGTIRRIGEVERADYGRTLIGMTCQKHTPLLLTATTMTGSKNSIKERIVLIAKKPKMAVYTLVAVILIATVAVSCTFTGANKQSATPPETFTPMAVIENTDDYFAAMNEAKKAETPAEEVVVAAFDNNEQVAHAWIEAWLATYKELPEDNNIRLFDFAVDDLKITKVSKEGLQKAFVFSATVSIQPNYPIDQNSYWMAGNTGPSPGRDETWGQFYREVELRLEDDGKYHCLGTGTGGVGDMENYDLIKILESPLLTRDMTVGIGIMPDYVDSEILVFHGYFGLFVYDLKAEQITLAVDLEKAVGSTIIQGSEGAAVRSSFDGNTVQLFFYPEQGEPEYAYTINPRTGEYSYGKYKPLDTYFSPGDDLYSRFTHGTLEELSYTNEEKTWLLFKDWAWQDEIKSSAVGNEQFITSAGEILGSIDDQGGILIEDDIAIYVIGRKAVYMTIYGYNSWVAAGETDANVYDYAERVIYTPVGKGSDERVYMKIDDYKAWAAAGEKDADVFDFSTPYKG